MEAMVIIKVAGFLLSVYIEIERAAQKDLAWIACRKFQVTEIDLLVGYYASTLICAIFLEPNVPAYAIWTFYAITLGAFALFRQSLKTHINKLVMALCSIIIAEIITVCMIENFFWHFQVTTIIAGILGAIIVGCLIPLCRLIIIDKSR